MSPTEPDVTITLTPESAIDLICYERSANSTVGGDLVQELLLAVIVVHELTCI